MIDVHNTQKERKNMTTVNPQTNEPISTTQAVAFAYLNDLRESGTVNMFGAVPYLQGDIGLSKFVAKQVLSEWMSWGFEATKKEAS
jgi:hypothetical protein